METIEENKKAILKKYRKAEDFERVYSPSKFFFSKIFFSDDSELVVVMTSTQRNYFFKSKLCRFAYAIGGLGYAVPKNN